MRINCTVTSHKHLMTSVHWFYCLYICDYQFILQVIGNWRVFTSLFHNCQKRVNIEKQIGRREVYWLLVYQTNQRKNRGNRRRYGSQGYNFYFFRFEVDRRKISRGSQNEEFFTSHWKTEFNQNMKIIHFSKIIFPRKKTLKQTGTRDRIRTDPLV